MQTQERVNFYLQEWKKSSLETLHIFHSRKKEGNIWKSFRYCIEIENGVWHWLLIDEFDCLVKMAGSSPILHQSTDFCSITVFELSLSSLNF